MSALHTQEVTGLSTPLYRTVSKPRANRRDGRPGCTCINADNGRRSRRATADPPATRAAACHKLRAVELVIVGGGKMGEALLRGLVDARWAESGELAVVEPVAARRRDLKKRFPGVTVGAGPLLERIPRSSVDGRHARRRCELRRSQPAQSDG